MSYNHPDQGQDIMELIETNDEYVVGGLLALYAQQTLDEQGSGSTIHENSVGFNGVDGSVLSDISNFYIQRGYLSPKQIKYVRKTIQKYHGQLRSLNVMPQPINRKERKEHVGTFVDGVRLWAGSFEGGKKIQIKFNYPRGDSRFREMVQAVKHNLEGRRWNPDSKTWTMLATFDNAQWLKEQGFEFGATLEEWYQELAGKYTKSDIEPIKNIEGLQMELYGFQAEGVGFIDQKQGRALIGDEMGCVSHDTIIQLNRAGRSFKLTIEEAYNKLQGDEWDKDIKTKTRALKDDSIGLHPIKDIIYKGVKNTIVIELKSGRSIKLTPDHEIAQPDNIWTEAKDLSIGDSVLINGKTICKNCGSDKNIVTYKYAKFRGYCKACIYNGLRKNGVEGGKKFKHTDGYIYLTQNASKDALSKHAWYIAEHVYIMENHIGRPLRRSEEVHHINGIRDDNRLENLKIMTRTQHKKEHKSHMRFHGGHTRGGTKIYVVPEVDTITNIHDGKPERVYDIIMEDPYRNFVANGIIVHNCGKTAQAIAWLLHKKAFPAVVIPPASLKLNWEREVKMWCGDNATSIAIHGRPHGVDRKIPDADIIIINYDIISDAFQHIRNDDGDIVETKIKQIGWGKILERGKIKSLILDEIHYLKDSKTHRTKAVRKLAKNADYIIGLSGTPIVNRPVEFFNTLNMIAPEMFPNWWKYTERYCNRFHDGYGWNASGASNKEELHKRLTESIMLRRLKKDVLKDLPPKIRTVVPIEIDNMDEYNTINDELIKWIRATAGQENAEKASNAEALVKIEALKQCAVRGKMNVVINWIEDFLESDEKLVVFATHHSTIDTIVEHFRRKVGTVKLDGRDTPERKQMAIDRFQKNNSVKLFVGNIKAAGVGITLTKASNTCFVELGWTSGDHDQAEDRCHRIGQDDSVTAWYLLAQHTVEEDIAKLIDGKRQILASILDGETVDDKSMLTELLNSILGKREGLEIR